MDKAEIEALKAANPILDVLRDLGLTPQHNRIRCLRPENHVHGDRTPSLTIWPERGAFKCWVCPDVKGDVIDLVRLARGCSFREALEYLSRNTLGEAPLPPLRAAHAAVPRPHRADEPAAPLHAEAHARHRSQGEADLMREKDPGFEPELDLGATAEKNAQVTSEERHIDVTLSGKDSGPDAPVPAKPGFSGPDSRAEGPGQNLADAILEMDDEVLRSRVLSALLEMCPPVGGKVGQYLQKRRIFKRTWERQGLRMIDDYAGVSRKLQDEFGLADLAHAGFFNPAGHLRFYRHRLLFPYYDAQGRPVYMQARATEPEAAGPKGPGPKELSLAGHIPIPYNSRLLDGEPGQIYLCEGVIDTLTLIEQGFPAVGVPGAANFKPAWAALFRNKSVHVAFDPDNAGESGAAKAMERLHAAGIEARRLAPPEGMDLNDWFRKG